MKTLKSKKQGFTIIEVVLVLAIAGLIFIMVFVALPALQRSQRDAQRKNQLNTILDAFERCKSLNRGRCEDRASAPTGNWKLAAWNKLINSYIPDKSEITDPSTGEIYKIYVGSVVNISGDAALDTLSLGVLGFDVGATCQNGRMVNDDGVNQEKVATTMAIVMKLEGGGLYCVSNN